MWKFCYLNIFKNYIVIGNRTQKEKCIMVVPKYIQRIENSYSSVDKITGVLDPVLLSWVFFLFKSNSKAIENRIHPEVY